jgi:hypothetical protein
MKKAYRLCVSDKKCLGVELDPRTVLEMEV